MSASSGELELSDGVTATAHRSTETYEPAAAPRRQRFSTVRDALRRTSARLVRYGVVSIVTLVLNQILLLSMAIAFAHMSAVAISIISTSVVAVPSFELHRRWVWKKKGRSRLMKEVVPYVTLAFVGLVLSTACVALAVSLSHPLVHDRVAHAAVTDGAYLFGYMVLWGFRFVLLERYVFGRPNDPR